jgi:glycosyltransferase involved in cell wall biosynthesis
LPKVTVLLPVYNAAPFLREAIDSILAQAFTDFELLAIDDGSTDGSGAILASYTDARLRVVRHSENRGLIATLNEGLELATGEYVARMDADDISLPTRLSRQVAFMDSHPDVGLSGAWAKQIGEGNRLMAKPLTHDAIRCDLLFDSAFIHPLVIFRRALLIKHDLRYGDFRHAEDLHLWREAAALFSVANLPDVLLHYRMHSSSVTGDSANQAAITESLRRSDQITLSRLSIEPTDDELALHNLMRGGVFLPIDAAEAWLTRLRDANRDAGVYPRDAFEAVIAQRWYHVCHGATGWGGSKWHRYRQSALRGPISMVQTAKFLARVR